MAISKVEAPKRSILSHETYLTIRHMLLNHNILPGQKIKIDGIAAQLQVSQTPVREALAKLASEGLVVQVALKGYAATKLLEAEEIDDLFRFRAIIEPWAASAAAKNRTEEDVASLKLELKAGEEARELDIENAYEAMSTHDSRFHSLITSMSGSKEVRDAFSRMHCHLHLFRLHQVLKTFLAENVEEAELVHGLFELYYQPSGGYLAFREHEAIAQAVIDGNSELAETLMREHIEFSRLRFGPAMREIVQSRNPKNGNQRTP